MFHQILRFAGLYAAAMLLTLAFVSTSISAAERSPYQAMGGPAKPKVAAHWNRFHDYAQATALLKKLAAAHPQYAKLQSLGQSYGKREMWLMTITAPGGNADTKPAFWIDGGIHANEIQSVEVVLYTAWFLLEMAGQNKAVDQLLKDRTFYLVPMMSPDARDAHFYEPNTTHSPRTGLRPVDDDKDGKSGEDGYDDLDGDGSITQMRIRDPEGKWKDHEKYPGLMVRVAAGEKGQYTLLGQEGIDNDGDGRVNEDGPGVYDPNRDWAWDWQPNYVQRGARRYPFWVKENRMVADFIRSRPNIAGGQTYHNAGGMILRGPGAKTGNYDRSDIAVYDILAKEGGKLLPEYRYLNVATELYEVWGGEFDWLHHFRGVFAFNNELFTPFNYFREHEEGTGWFGSQETQHLFNKYLLLGDGFSKWKPVDHPQYGKIEVGGLRKNWIRQPPSFLMEEELHRNAAFTLYHASEMPLVQIDRIETERLENNITQVTAVISNPKVTPTHSAADIRHRITPPDEVTLSGPGIKQIFTAMHSPDRVFRSPQIQTRKPQTVKLSRIGGQSVVYVRWLVEGAGPFTVSIKSVKGGSGKLTK